MPRFTIIIPTIGRTSLRAALQSIENQLGQDDEVIVVGDGPQPAARAMVDEFDRRFQYLEVGPTHQYGIAQRNIGMSRAKGDFIAFLDDDDVYATDGLARMRAVIHKPVIHVFRMYVRNFVPQVVWTTKDVKIGNIMTPMIVVPNIPDRLGKWAVHAPPLPDDGHTMCDVEFLRSTLALWPSDSIVWRPEVIVKVEAFGYGNANNTSK